MKKIFSILASLFFLFGTFFVAHPVDAALHFATGTLYYVPVTITNSLSSPTPAPFQTMVSVNSSAYSSYLASNLSNVNWQDGAGNILNSWLESGNSNSATASVYWVKLPSGIPANSSVIIYLGFYATSANNFNTSNTGEAPTLSGTYGQYDNGTNVFSNYWNFAGTSAPPGFISLSGSSPSYNNGVTLTGALPGENIYYSSATISPSSYITESYTPSTPSAAWGGIIYTTVASSGGTYGLSTGYAAGGRAAQQIYSVNGGAYVYENGASISYPAIFGITWRSYQNATEYTNYGSVLPALTTDAPAYGNTYIGLGAWSSGIITFNWLRTRAYPPAGIMPSDSFGSITSLTVSFHKILLIM